MKFSPLSPLPLLKAQWFSDPPVYKELLTTSDVSWVLWWMSSFHWFCGPQQIYIYVQTGIAACVLVCVLAYFPAKPPSPPSVAVSQGHLGYRDSLSALAKNSSFWWLAVLFGLQSGVLLGWMSVFAIAVSPFGISQLTAGWLGCASSLAGFVSGVVLARYFPYYFIMFVF